MTQDLINDEPQYDKNAFGTEIFGPEFKETDGEPTIYDLSNNSEEEFPLNFMRQEKYQLTGDIEIDTIELPANLEEENINRKNFKSNKSVGYPIDSNLPMQASIVTN